MKLPELLINVMQKSDDMSNDEMTHTKQIWLAQEVKDFKWTIYFEALSLVDWAEYLEGFVRNTIWRFLRGHFHLMN